MKIISKKLLCHLLYYAITIPVHLHIPKLFKYTACSTVTILYGNILLYTAVVKFLYQIRQELVKCCPTELPIVFVHVTQNFHTVI